MEPSEWPLDPVYAATLLIQVIDDIDERDRKERDLTSAQFETVLASSHGDRFVCGRAES